MKTEYTEIKPAIARSISHNENVLLVVPDIREAVSIIDNDENVSQLDYETDIGGDEYVWGTYLNKDFRITIRKA